MPTIDIGFSPCPNDTFIFDALVNHKIDTKGYDFKLHLEDVQTLNEWALQSKLPYSKISYGVWPKLKNQYKLLESGGALGNGVAGLIELMDLLRSKDGCPWDNEQTHQSLIEYLLEESYEFAEAVESGNRQAIREELGDVLLQVVFHSKIAQEHLQDPFNIDDVADVITNKLIKRHPHIFSDSKDLTSLEVENNWEMIKQKEKSRTSITDGVPVAMPALMHADKLITRVKSVKDEIAQVKETQLVNDVKKDLNSEAEVGQFLLSFVAMCNERGIDSESALRKAISQYRDEIKKSEN